MRDERGSAWGHVLILVGLGLLALWALRPLVATVVADNVGSVALNRALLKPGLAPEERTAWAVQAGRAFETALAWDPLNGAAYYNLATVYDVWQDTSSAARVAARAAVLRPHDASARFRLGQALAAAGLEQRAIEEWRAAGAAPYFVNQGLALAHAGDYAGALEEYERALAIDAEVPEGTYRLGQVLSALGREEEAVAAFEAAAALEAPSSARRYLLQGEVHAARGEWRAALVAFDQAARLSPQDPAPYYRMGWVLHEGLGDDEAAIAEFQWALHLEPDDVSSRLALGRLHAERGDCDEATRWLSPLLSPDAGSGVAGEAYVLVGSCLLAQGRDDEAVSYLEQASVLSPRSVRTHLLLAQGYSQVGRYHDAMEAYLRVLELAPDSARARQALEELGWSGGTDDGE